MKNQIKNYRNYRGITQQECADAIGISVRTLQRYERGETQNLRAFSQIARYLDVSLTELLDENKD